MDTKKILYMASWMVVGWLLAIWAAAYAGNWNNSSLPWFGFWKWFERWWCERFGRWSFETQKPPFADKITKNVVNTASGAEITLTTTDSWALAFLQMTADFNKDVAPIKDAKIQVNKTKLDNWVKITVTWTTAEEIKAIQDRAAKEPIMMLWRWPRWMWEGKGFWMWMMADENIKRDVKNLDNGIEITMTTTDSGSLAHLQQMADMMKDKQPQWTTDITVKHTKLDNWMKVTITSTNADTVKKIQESKWMGPMWGAPMMGWRWWHKWAWRGMMRSFDR